MYSPYLFDSLPLPEKSLPILNLLNRKTITSNQMNYIKDLPQLTSFLINLFQIINSCNILFSYGRVLNGINMLSKLLNHVKIQLILLILSNGFLKIRDWELSKEKDCLLGQSLILRLF